MDIMTDTATNELQDQALRLAQEVEATAACTQRLRELLPNSAEIMAQLNSGTFISSSGHIKLHKELNRHAKAYGDILALGGNILAHHPAGFYYLQPKDGQVINLRERQMAAAIFCTVEFMSDRGLPVESMINSEDPISLSDISSLVDHHRERLSELGLGTQEEFIANGLKKLCEAGVMHTQQNSKGETAYCFGIPTYFYLDIAKKLAKSVTPEAGDHIDYPQDTLPVIL
ncbi:MULTISPECIES: condensin complex protein MksE [Pseudomonas]|uniref:condensin complex protein MksE n=1 Tax=Pseudomonas TaxID=286 RepID=UPI001781E701|nr:MULTISPECIES: hypothetical protein [Pseudomonas]MBD8615196.1 hypothetical protein [Pseudomonas putida]MBD8682150.1 hypothetical protein [Pseudomonas sp. CFBP 13719]